MKLKKEYNNKLIYAFYGLGKSSAKALDNSLIETDDILSKLFRSDSRNLYDAMSKSQKNFPDVYNYTMDNFKSYVDTDLKKGGTVLTSNDRLLSKANYIFLPKDLDKTIQGLKSKSRSNPFTASKSKLETKIKKIRTIAASNSIPIIETDDYLSNYILE